MKDTFNKKLMQENQKLRTKAELNEYKRAIENLEHYGPVYDLAVEHFGIRNVEVAKDDSIITILTQYFTIHLRYSWNEPKWYIGEGLCFRVLGNEYCLEYLRRKSQEVEWIRSVSG